MTQFLESCVYHMIFLMQDQTTTQTLSQVQLGRINIITKINLRLGVEETKFNYDFYPQLSVKGTGYTIFGTSILLEIERL